MLVFVPVMSAVILVVEHRQRSAIVHEVHRRGEVLARTLGAASQGPLLLYNFTALEQNVARVAREADVSYAIVLDADGRIAAHSRHPDRVGSLLTGRDAGDTPLVRERRKSDTGEALFEFTVPIMVERRRWGTSIVALSRHSMEAEIRETRRELAALTVVTLVLSAAAAAFVARRIARPVQQLADGVAAISRGDLNQSIQPSTADEIGRLAIAFNHMASQLLQQRTALEAAHAELRQRFEELADLKSYTDNVLGSVTTGIVTVDLDGRIVTLNPAAELLTGYFQGEASGRYCSELFARSSSLGELLMETLASGSPAPSVTMTLTRRSGAAVPVECSVTPLKGGDGKDLGAVAVVRDLTVVRDLEQQLARSDRLASLGTLAAGLAHEIKNPLTSLLTFSRHLARRFDDPAFREKFQEIVPRELERINGIVEGLLDLARPPRRTSAAVRLPSLVDRALALYGPEIEARAIDVTREYARNLPPVEADEESLYQAVVNLVHNAVDAMTTGGRLTLRVGWPEARDRDAAARPGREGRRLKVEVEDTGVGIPPTARDRIFDPFFTTKEQGTGLGLALTHKIIEDHGGTITFTSGSGSGTTFRITLPIAAPTPPAGEHAAERGW